MRYILQISSFRVKPWLITIKWICFFKYICMCVCIYMLTYVYIYQNIEETGRDTDIVHRFIHSPNGCGHQGRCGLKSEVPGSSAHGLPSVLFQNTLARGCVGDRAAWAKKCSLIMMQAMAEPTLPLCRTSLQIIYMKIQIPFWKH